ncbi:hypothetical protein JOD29_003003 [Lysinibacillus composti]|nr:hypothetical protein [Lysinibacillus composti]
MFDHTGVLILKALIIFTIVFVPFLIPLGEVLFKKH